MAGPLAGLRVVDLTQVLAGPYCTMVLADLGADVIKVEPPGGDMARQWGPHPQGADAASYGGYFASVNRNKRSVCIDIKDPAGREQFLSLLGTADVLIENFRAGVMNGLDLSWEQLHTRFPALVYGSIRGFGDPRTGDSPYRDRPAFDIIAQAMGGLMSVTGEDAAHPMKVGPGIGDIFPAVLAAVGIVAAVREADTTGVGRFVDVAMYDAVLALSERIVYQHSITGKSPEPRGNSHPILCPYGVVPTASGSIAIAAPSDRHWARLARAMGRPELATDPSFATNDARLTNADAVYGAVEAWTRTLPTEAVVEKLAGHVPCGPVNTAADIVADEHVAVRRMIIEVEHPGGRTVQIAGSPIKLADDTAIAHTRAPLLGEHNDEILAELAAHDRGVSGRAITA
ncbi:CaiB/BaiF CoA transferase family protein [Pseudonocardia endophytica]|uniref:Crotonobetainyl-CoA:carnitine CoA-transferase CaiB-like acyl-CoA transferase n=1 Tax=Pseudonocardia endophytica TaxID=401976 RepID=A0A4R1I2U5_PSEEN|nr:CoA transferase [Pseudonocardia endophytica]TCK27630.1 crotonobetainyl-CoA:carnitine CoA-transferase CaiB-like acyl-CoA transferase [Pseudonocardia endophytica]